EVQGPPAPPAPGSILARMEASMDSNRSVSWTVVATSLGALLVAGSERGGCRIAFGGRERGLLGLLARELPFARFERGGRRVEAWAAALARAVEGDGDPLEIPLDVAGSRYQRRAWGGRGAVPRGGGRSDAPV